MGRADFKRGRFTAAYETAEIHDGLRGWQSTVGDHVDWWRYSRPASTKHDVYDEGASGGRVYSGPLVVPALHVIHTDGAEDDSETGFYAVDGLEATIAFRQLARTGITRADVFNRRYLRDRLVYDDAVFDITQILVLGQIQQADVIVAVTAVQTKPDEMVNDTQFKRWASDSQGLPYP